MRTSISICWVRGERRGDILDERTYCCCQGLGRIGSVACNRDRDRQLVKDVVSSPGYLNAPPIAGGVARNGLTSKLFEAPVNACAVVRPYEIFARLQENRTAANMTVK